jgi:tRNA pseudouridine55 synthase
MQATTVSQRSSKSAQPKRQYRDVTGILLLDKPTGITSNRALQQARRIFQARKGGHTGSLDPLASGMLPLCFGQATKVSAWLLDSDKGYEVEIKFGERTDTADADGTVIATESKVLVAEADLEQALAMFRGEIQQIPPMYSALKKDGKRLYELARQGQEVEREPRSVTIFELELRHYDPVHPRFFVRCSKGTYIRTLMEDVAAAAGTLAHVTALRRTHVDPFTEHPMINMAELEANEGNPEALDALLIGSDLALPQFGAVRLTANEAFYLRHGHEVGHAPAGLTGLVRVYDDTDQFLGVGTIGPDGSIAPKRLFVAAPEAPGKPQNQGVT